MMLWKGVWNILLIAISAVLFGYAFYKKRDLKLIVFLFFLAGLIYIFEMVILIFFQGYEFKPRFMGNPDKDNIAGALVSDFFIVPSASIVLSVFRRGFKAMIVVSMLFMIIEEAFLKLNIYQHYWWKTIYTGISLPMLFWIGTKVWGYITHRIPDRLKRFWLLYFCHISLHSTLFYPLVVINAFSLKIGWFENPYRDWVAFGLTYRCLFYSLAAAFVAVNRKNRKLFFAGYLCMLGTCVLLNQWGILHIFAWYFVLLLLFVDGSALYVLTLFDRMLTGKKKTAKPSQHA